VGLRHVASTVVAALAVVVVPGGVAARAPQSWTVGIPDQTLDVDSDLASQFGGRVDVTVRFRVENTGDAPVQPTARIELESQIGGGTASAPMELRVIAPGDSVDVTRTAGSLLPFGSAHVTVTVRTDDEVTTASSSTPVIPWLLLLTIVGVLVAAVVVRRVRRLREPQRG
jgi:hypothetical protein